MGAIKRRHSQSDTTRDKISVSLIVRRLQMHVLGLTETVNGPGNKAVERLVKLSSEQVTAAKILLGKVLPDLQAIQMDAKLDLTMHEAALKELES